MSRRVEVSDDWGGEVGSAIEQFFQDKLGPDIAADARRYCPVDTGALKDSIEHHLENGDLIVSATGSDERSYAYFVEMGARPHVILPKQKKALYWDGAPHPVRKVNHPGNKPEPFLRPALFQQRGE